MMARTPCFTFVASGLVCCLSSGFAQQTAPTLQRDSPLVRHFVAPDYPVAAWLAGVQGNAVMELVIRQDGTVDSAKLVSGYPIFRKSLETALAKWTFRVDKATKMNISTRFTQDGDCSSTAPKVTDKRSRVETQVSADLPSNIEIRACPPIIEISVDQSHHR
jgi:hypothetical protein